MPTNLSSRFCVVIRRGARLVQRKEYVVPEPIPERRYGYFRRKRADYGPANTALLNLRPVRWPCTSGYWQGADQSEGPRRPPGRPAPVNTRSPKDTVALRAD